MDHTAQDRIKELEQEGLQRLRDGDHKAAAEIFSTIVERAPDYEHGACFYDLAVCLEELGQFAQAEVHFKRALEYLPDDTVRLGGYASFLYLYGKPEDAFRVHLRLLHLFQRQKNATGEQRALLAIRTLGSNTGLSEEEVTRAIESYRGLPKHLG